MDGLMRAPLSFTAERLTARFAGPAGEPVSRSIEVRTNPVTGRRSRITFSRQMEREPGTGRLPSPPPDAHDTTQCPFCPGGIESRTPRFQNGFGSTGTMRCGDSVLFPNLFPYGAYSAVSIFDAHHFVEIGTAQLPSYANCLRNCAAYLASVAAKDPDAHYMAITQNHLPAAGGSLVHPHLQVHADPIPSNHHHFLKQRAAGYRDAYGKMLFSAYLESELADGQRMIGITGRWHWLAAFAPEGFYEIWGILPLQTSLFNLTYRDWHDLADGILRAQRFYRSLFRNSYNFGLLSVECEESVLELRAALTVRSNYAPWVRSDMTGYERMLGDMATFHAPEQIADQAAAYWDRSG